MAERGDVEIELGPLGFVSDAAGRALVAPSLVVNWGFADAFELVAEARQVVRVGAARGAPALRVEDAALSVKRVLRDGGLQERAGPSVAVEASALLPDVHGDGGAGAQGVVIASWRWPDLTVHLNGGAAWSRAHRPALLGGAIVEVHDAWSVRPVAELAVEAERDAPAALSVLGGAIWRVRESLSVDAALRGVRAGGANGIEVRAGLTWAFGAGWPGARGTR